MRKDEPDGEERPFVRTSIARHLLSRLRLAHEERAIAVFSGPWGIGKTTAIDAFKGEEGSACVVVKVDPGSSRRGASPIAILQLTIEALRPLLGKSTRATLSNAYWSLRQMLYKHLDEWPPFEEFKRADEYYQDNRDWMSAEERLRAFPGAPPPLTFIFDEAQYLSREAIEMLRFWNDGDRTTTPLPVGLAFVGNNEFSLGDDGSGQSVLSGAVRSRALFIERLDYADITDQDLVLFAQSRGVTDAAAIAAVIRYYSTPRIARDLRNVERLLATLKRRSKGEAVTGADAQQFFELV